MATLRERFPLLVEHALAVAPQFEVSAYADLELSGLAGSHVWDIVARQLVESVIVVAPSGRTIGELFPDLEDWASFGLVDGQSIGRTGVLSLRSINALLRSGVSTWGQLANLEMAQLLSLRNFGLKSASEVLTACFQLAGLGPPHGSRARRESVIKSVVLRELLETRWLLRAEQRALARDASGVRSPTSRPPQGADSELQDGELAGHIQTIVAWAWSERSVSNLGGVLRIAQELKPFPEDVATAWNRLSETETTSVANPAGAAKDLDSLLDGALTAFSERERAVLEARLLTLEPQTLQELATTFGVTRERIRQIQAKAERRLDTLLRLPRFRVLAWRAADVAAALGRLAMVSHPVTDRVLERAVRGASASTQPKVLALILRQAGGYTEKNGWFTRNGTSPLSTTELATLCDETGLIPVGAAHQWLFDNGVMVDYHDDWLTGPGHMRRFGDHFSRWEGSIVDKCVTILAVRGVPANTETLVSIVGEGQDVRAAQNRFFEDTRLMRVNRTEWALRAWGMEEYTGIAEEMAQRIEEAGGRARLADVAKQLVATFSVSEGSVKAYAYAPMFVREQEWIRVRRADEPYTVRGVIADCGGVYELSDSHFAVSVPVDVQALRGSGRSLPEPVAFCLGVRPGEAVAYQSGPRVLRVTWPLSGFLGGSVGSIRELAADAGSVEGDLLRLDFDVQNAKVSARTVHPATVAVLEPIAALRLLTGIDDLSQPLDAVAKAIGVTPERVLAALRSRGDGKVADLLATVSGEKDGGLDEALEELARRLFEPGRNT